MKQTRYATETDKNKNIMAKNNEKQGLNLYKVTFYYHTNCSVFVKASSKEEALKRADSVTITDDELIEGLQSDDSPDAELVEENVEPDKEDGIVMCNDSVIVNGASFHGVTIISTVNNLEKALGKPTNGDGGYKVNYEWKLKVRHEGREFVVSVYDWKDGYFGRDQQIEFHIGGFGDTDELIARGYIVEKLAEASC